MAERKAWADQGSRHARGYGSAWDKLRKRKLSADPLCEPCLKDGLVTVATQVDHVTPKAKGGTDDWSNLQSICKEHHDAKTARERGERPKVRIGVDGWPV